MRTLAALLMIAGLAGAFWYCVTVTLDDMTRADCRKVEALWRGVDGVVEGFYSDQAATYGTELYRRRQNRR